MAKTALGTDDGPNPFETIGQTLVATANEDADSLAITELLMSAEESAGETFNPAAYGSELSAEKIDRLTRALHDGRTVHAVLFGTVVEIKRVDLDEY